MNKPRLIDANELHYALIDLFQEIDDMYIAGRVISVVNLQPTVYDIDKVIKGLINNTQECTDRITYETHSFVPLFDAIKIVKGGVK